MTPLKENQCPRASISPNWAISRAPWSCCRTQACSSAEWSPPQEPRPPVLRRPRQPILGGLRGRRSAPCAAAAAVNLAIVVVGDPAGGSAPAGAGPRLAAAGQQRAPGGAGDPSATAIGWGIAWLIERTAVPVARSGVVAAIPLRCPAMWPPTCSSPRWAPAERSCRRLVRCSDRPHPLDLRAPPGLAHPLPWRSTRM